ncbi:MAG: UvrB/UvrC motif-containing protein, partial [Bacteroidota bacterium]
GAESTAQKPTEKSTGRDTAESEAQEAVESGEEISELRRAKLIKRLTEQMEEAINKEDYEKAARLRDQITKLEDGGTSN